MDKRDVRIKCTVCKDSQNIIVLHKDALSLHRCLKCGTIFLGGYSDGFVPELYSYYDKYGNLSKEDVFDPITSTRCQDLLRRFSRLVSGREVLDVGCGLGQFIDVANRSGWIAEGLDLSRGALDFAHNYGLPVQEVDFLSEDINPNSYDLVTLFEVIEHVTNPAEFIYRAGEVVRPGGLVYLTTPNFASLDRFLLGKDWEIIHPEHLTYFTPRTLRALVKKTDCFEILNFETRNLSMAALQVLSCGLYVLIPSVTNSYDKSENGCNAPFQMNKLRCGMESSIFLGLLKRFVNSCLNAAGMGGTMCMLLRRSLAETAVGDKTGLGSKAFRQTI